ncbi:HNH endonuclease [Anaeromyxobacter paludicola]|uniref:HNH endonuclease n=1 Tax=Anaeromyxobacter paludicola TaxID=2918171 RepID=A0ABM7XDD6_9BACT|nr:hypothetical protein [Anaeromyxobacter paludicola]BDG09895.1 hypothetical protein AMPC_30080 [Anaeromyxobacter paludicola]
MNAPLSFDLTALSDRALLEALTSLVRREREVTAEVVAHLAEVDARRLYRDHACPSMHAYCVGVLHLADEAAYKRINAARTARRFPAVLEMLADGRLHLSAVCLLAQHLTEENHGALLDAAVHRSKRDIEELLAERFPRPDVPAALRKLPSPLPRFAPSAPPEAPPLVAPPQAPSLLPRPEAPSLLIAPEAPSRRIPPAALAPSAPVVAPPPPPRPVLAPLAPERYRLQLTISRQTRDRLEEARDLLGHQMPAGDLAEVVDRALELLVRELRKRKFAETRTPRAPRSAPATEGSRHIPHHVRREVALRDGNQCTFVAEDGRRCPARRRLEFHHQRVAFAKGGEGSADNLCLRCTAHHGLATEQEFGREHVARRVAEARLARERLRGAKAPSPGVASTPRERRREAKPPSPGTARTASTPSSFAFGPT